MTYLDTVQIFRCQGCGKWSHAKKQPRKHQRWVQPGEDGFEWEKNENGFGEVPDGHGIDCGPFAPYVASPGRYRR